MGEKRKRGSNFTSEEVSLLVKMAEVHSAIIENKKSDAVTWKEKEKAWSQIATAFNLTFGEKRTGKCLKMKYESIKKKTRKKSAMSTGEKQGDLTEERDRGILLSVDGLDNTSDGDQLLPGDNTLESFDFSECSVPSTSNVGEVTVWDSLRPSLMQTPVTSNPASTSSASGSKKSIKDINGKFKEHKLALVATQEAILVQDAELRRKHAEERREEERNRAEEKRKEAEQRRRHEEQRMELERKEAEQRMRDAEQRMQIERKEAEQRMRDKEQKMELERKEAIREDEIHSLKLKMMAAQLAKNNNL